MNKSINGMFETASFHIVKPCNMKCKFCYATFQDMKIIKQLPLVETKKILDKLKKAGLQKITFAGGEPFLYKWLFESIVYSKQIGLTTSVVTNGYFLNNDILDKYQNHLDWIGISIDSLNEDTNIKIGRVSKEKNNYYELIKKIKEKKFKLKINTVVNKYNQSENMQDFIDFANPLRWKIFDTLKIEGQNDKEFDNIKTINDGFVNFCNNHNHPSMVIENNQAMTGSYLLIDPQGRLFENSQNKHTYSSPLQNNDIHKCLNEISLDKNMFIKRGGIYEW